MQLLQSGETGLTLIFVETKQRANILERLLTSKGLPVTAIHGDKDQAARTWALKNFSTGKKPILIATNVAARGLDINDISHVINVDMPREIDSYVHRIGRTGRAGKNGISITFLSQSDGGIINSLIQTLHDGNQEVPSWFYELRREGKSFRGRSNYSGGKFGGRDYRSSYDSKPYARPNSYSNGSTYSNGSNGSNYSNGSNGSSYSNYSSYSNGAPPAPQRYNYPPPPSYPQGQMNGPPMPPSVPSYAPSTSYGPVPSSANGQYQQRQPYSAPSNYYNPSKDADSYYPQEDKKRRADSVDDSSRDKLRKTDSGKYFDKSYY